MSCIGKALGLTLLQLLLALAFAHRAGGSGWVAHYRQLCNWDSAHYASVVREGFHLVPGRPRDALPVATPDDIHSLRTNVTRFPAYPWIAAALQKVMGATAEISLLLTAQAFAFGFWLLLLLALARARVSARDQAIAVAAIGLHPAAFFLIVGYTESLFVFSLLAFILLSDAWLDNASLHPSVSRRSFAGAAVAGIVLTATRIVGIPLVGYPVLKRFLKTRRLSIASLALAAIASLGCLGFFAFCQWKFGHWDLYLVLQRIGWDNHPDFLAIVKPLSYLPRFFFEDTVDSINRLAVPATAGLLVFLVIQERRRAGQGGGATRGPIYYLAFVMFYIAMSANAKMDGMIRYSYPSFILLIFGWAQLGFPKTSLRGRFGWIALGLLSLAAQCWFIYRFTLGHWVA